MTKHVNTQKKDNLIISSLKNTIFLLLFGVK